MVSQLKETHNSVYPPGVCLGDEKQLEAEDAGEQAVQPLAEENHCHQTLGQGDSLCKGKM